MLTKQQIQDKKQEAIQATEVSSAHVDRSVFIKTPEEKARLKKLKKEVGIGLPLKKLVFA